MKTQNLEDRQNGTELLQCENCGASLHSDIEQEHGYCTACLFKRRSEEPSLEEQGQKGDQGRKRGERKEEKGGEEGEEKAQEQVQPSTGVEMGQAGAGEIDPSIVRWIDSEEWMDPLATRIPDEWREELEDRVRMMGLNKSEYIRLLIGLDLGEL